MKKGIILPLLLLTGALHAQTLTGKLFGENNEGREVLPGGTVQWIGGGKSIVVNENGVFELKTEGVTDKRVVATATGYTSDTLSWDGGTYLSITLQRSPEELSGVVVEDRRGARISNRAVIKTEIINAKELSKAACCDLAGCFGTQASVQPQTTNVVTNSQELRLLGLSGVYNQVLVDGMPMIQGATYTYGISTYPGAVVDNITVAKGATSVLQGFESISGQISLNTLHPDIVDRVYLNTYLNSFGEKHFNANLAASLGKNKKWHTLLTLHSVQPASRVDGNKDGFLDLPLLTRYMVYNKWKYGNETEKGVHAQFGLRFVNEQRLGGQKDYRSTTHKGSASQYGQFIAFNQPELYAKTGFRFSADHALAFSIAGSVHNQDSWFGTLSYQSRQQVAYANLQHEMRWSGHQLKYGASYRYQELTEDIGFSVPDTRTYAGNYLTRLRVPGFFAENTFNFEGEKLVLIAGARMDHHQVQGWYFTPRSMLKFSFNNNHTLRASAGTGWRQVNLFSEHPVILTSSRNLDFAEPLKPEEALNWGLSHTWNFYLGASTTGTLSVDFYQTRFQNQFFPDYDPDPSKIVIRNFEGNTRSNGLQVDAAFTFFTQLEVKAAYNYLDVYRKEGNTKLELPFNPRNRAMTAVSYSTLDSKWQMDLSANWYDKMRLPDTRMNPEAYRRPSNSDPYATMNLQGTYRLNALELYVGCENIFNYRQANPIISADNPFGPYFDLASVWGPTRGREVYLGLRYSIKR